MKVKILIAFASLMILMCFTACSRKPAEVTVLYTNDVHSNVDNYPLLAEYTSELKKQGRKVILADGGDFVQGTLYGKIDNGSSVIDIMNCVGYDFAVPGNHDYDYGTEVFLKNAEKSDFDYISCNFPGSQEENDAFSHEKYYITENNGCKVAFVGIESCSDTDGIAETVQAVVDEARGQGAQVVIAVGHTGGESTSPIIENTKGIDIFLNAHDHVMSDGEENRLSYTAADGREVPVFEAGSEMKYVCRLDIQMTKNDYEYMVKMMTPEDLQNELGDAPSSEALAAYDKTEKMVDAIKLQMEQWNKTVGTSECILCVYDPVKFPMCNDYKEYNSSDFIADALRSIADTDIAIINTSSLRKGLQKGSISKKDIYDLYPWFEKIYTVDVTGQQIIDILERGTANWPEYSSGQPAVSGMTFAVDLTGDGSSEGKVYDVIIGGEPININKTYSMASSVYYLFSVMSDIIGKDESQCSCIGIDYDIVEKYVTDTLGGVVPASLYGTLSGDGRIYLKTK